MLKWQNGWVHQRRSDVFVYDGWVVFLADQTENNRRIVRLQELGIFQVIFRKLLAVLHKPFKKLPGIMGVIKG